MAEVSVGLFGLGRLGASVGLALKRYNRKNAEHQFKITGYDTAPDHVKNAQKIQAVDHVDSRPGNVAAQKDVIVSAMPYGEVHALYDYIAPDLRPGAVILDLSTLKQKSLNWAKKNLSKDVHLVCVTPIVNPQYLFDGTDETIRASEDYFDNGVSMVMPDVRAIPEAITLATDFVKLLGSKPHFADPSEHDALVAGTEILPALLGVVYFNTLNKSEGWNDVQRFTNSAAGMLTHHLFDTHPDDLRDSWLDSSPDLLRHLDELIATLREFRGILAAKDRDAIESVLDINSKSYEQWINRRHSNRWQDDERLDTDAPSFGSMMGNMFGGFMGNRLNKTKKEQN